MEIKAGTVIATGGTATGERGKSYGIGEYDSSVKIVGGNLTAKAGSAANASNAFALGNRPTQLPSANDTNYWWRTSESGRFYDYDFDDAAYDWNASHTYFEIHDQIDGLYPTESADFTTDATAALALLNAAKTEDAADSTWDSGTKTLTLNGVKFTTEAATAVKLPEDAKIVLTRGTTNKIRVCKAISGDSCGIEAGGALTITVSEGSSSYGRLYVYGGEATNNSYGIKAEGAVTVEKDGTQVAAYGGTAMTSYGIYTNGGMTVKNAAEVYAIGGEATTSYGICVANGGMTVQDAAGVEAYGGTATNSYGIYTETGVTMNGGILLAAGTGASGATTVSALNKDPAALPGNGYYYSLDGSTGKDSDSDGAYSWSAGHSLVMILSKYTVTLDANGGSVTPATVKTNTSNQLTSLPTPTRSGYTFNEWNTAADGSGDTVYIYNSSGLSNKRFYANTTIYAQWTPVASTTYTITFIANGGKVNGNDTATATTGADGKLTSLPTPTRSGHTFNGWYTATSGGSKVDTDYVFGTDTTIYAQWTPVASTTYTITFNANGGKVNGNNTATATTGADGKLTSLPTPTRSGSYSFNGWYTAASGGTKVTTSTGFNANTTIYAQWTYTGGGGGGSYTPPTYKVESEVSKDADGSVSFSKSSAKKGDTVTITVTPDRYYKVAGVTVKDKTGKEIAVTDNGDGTFTFKMPDSKVAVEPVFSWDNPFTDVDEEVYYAPAVEWALKNDVTGGTTTATFSPNTGCTRAQIVTFLWRAAGCPEPADSKSFTDVSADAYYAKAVAWAAEQGITGGTGDGKFSPDAVCTRSQSMTFIYRSEQAQGGGMQGEWMFLNPFADVNLEDYYGEAVMWAVANGVTDGTSDTTFSPNATCTRGQIVTFLYRFFVK